MLITCYLDDDWRCHARTGPGHMTSTRFLLRNSFVGRFVFQRVWITITWSIIAQTLEILTDAYTSRIVRGQSTLKDVIERYFWNGLSRKRLKAMKALYALYALYAKYANVLVKKRTLVEKSKIWNLKPNCIYYLQSIEQHYYHETEEQNSNGANSLWSKKP